MKNKEKLCPECGEKLERYTIAESNSIIGETYPEETGWSCPKCNYTSQDFPIGCFAIPAIVIVLFILLKLLI